MLNLFNLMAATFKVLNSSHRWEDKQTTKEIPATPCLQNYATRFNAASPRNAVALKSKILLVASICLIWLCSSPLVLAKSKKPKTNETFDNPLEITQPDPLLPLPGQPLTPTGRLKLNQSLDQLNQQAAARLAAGDSVNAFAIWNRELRLRRSLGFQAEVEALGRVGAIAWSENQSQELQVITQRLLEIKQQISSQSIDLKLLDALGYAFQQVREPSSAIATYEQILATTRRSKDLVATQATLRTLAELNVSWFDYPKATAAYQELLNYATSQGDRAATITYLQQLDYIYEKAKQYQQALAVKQKLFALYQNDPQLSLSLPTLRLAIARDYQALRQVQAAFENYQQAYTSAWSLQQYALAGDALRQLISLYRSLGQIDAALQTSQILLEAEQRAGNIYGMMTAYDQIGQIYLSRANLTEALSAFQKGLEFANQLNYQQTYFAQQIQQINQRQAK